jgi:hypothetical protein
MKNTPKTPLYWYLVTDIKGKLVVQAESYAAVYDIVKTPLNIQKLDNSTALKLSISGVINPDLDLSPKQRARRLFDATATN